MSFIIKNKEIPFCFLTRRSYLLKLFLINCFIVPRFVLALAISSYTTLLIITCYFISLLLLLLFITHKYYKVRKK